MAAPRSQLLLLRHGIAEERSDTRPDAARSLTAAGRRRAAAVLERAVAMGIGADRLIASPLTRARQTAEIAVAAGLAPAMELATALAPGADPRGLLASWLNSRSADAAPDTPLRLALVGHEPDLSLLAARLLGAGPGAIRLRKAGFALLELPGAAGEEGDAGAAPPGGDPEAREPGGTGDNGPGGGRAEGDALTTAGCWQLQMLLTPRAMLA